MLMLPECGVGGMGTDDAGESAVLVQAKVPVVEARRRAEGFVSLLWRLVGGRIRGPIAEACWRDGGFCGSIVNAGWRICEPVVEARGRREDLWACRKGQKASSTTLVAPAAAATVCDGCKTDSTKIRDLKS